MSQSSCEHCSAPFTPTSGSEGRFCSRGCWYAYCRARKPDVCVVCGESFKARSTTQRACSRACRDVLVRRQDERSCEACSKPFTVKASSKQKYCSKSCATAAHMSRGGTAKPVGSTRPASGGYVMVKTPTGEWMLEHRYVMEQVLGRKLQRYETIHHKDGDRQNNAPENLEFRSSPHGVGATEAHCRTCTCFEHA